MVKKTQQITMLVENTHMAKRSLILSLIESERLQNFALVFKDLLFIIHLAEELVQGLHQCYFKD